MRDWSWSGLLLVLVCLSCTRAANGPPLFPVKGHVFYESKPANGAVVILHSTGNRVNASRPRGRADATGAFELTTYETGDGAAAGEYVVTVEWKRAEDHPEQGTELLPPVYGDPKTSKLSVTVTPGVNEPLILRLTARP